MQRNDREYRRADRTLTRTLTVALNNLVLPVDGRLHDYWIDDECYNWHGFHVISFARSLARSSVIKLMTEAGLCNILRNDGLVTRRVHVHIKCHYTRCMHVGTIVTLGWWCSVYKWNGDGPQHRVRWRLSLAVQWRNFTINFTPKRTYFTYFMTMLPSQEVQPRIKHVPAVLWLENFHRDKPRGSCKVLINTAASTSLQTLETFYMYEIHTTYTHVCMFWHSHMNIVSCSNTPASTSISPPHCYYRLHCIGSGMCVCVAMWLLCR